MTLRLLFSCLSAITLLVSGTIEERPQPRSAPTVKSVMDEVVTRLYGKFTPAQLDTLSDAYILRLLSEEEKQI